MTADPGMQRLVLTTVVTPRTPTRPRAAVSTVATNIHSLCSRSVLDTNLKINMFNNIVD